MATLLVVSAVASPHVVGVVHAATVTLDFETLPGGARMADGTRLVDQYEPVGVRFVPRDTFAGPTGAIAGQCSLSVVCSEGHSGDTVVFTPLRGSDEFNRHHLGIEFTEPQQSVSLFVQHYEFQNLPADWPASVGELLAFDSSGQQVDRSTVEFGPAEGWQRLAVDDSEGRIVSVELWFDRGSLQENWFIADDLQFEGADDPVPPDTTQPTVEIHHPVDGATITERTLDVRYTVRDDRQLAEVTYQVFNASTDDPIGTPVPIRLCRGRSCPAGTEPLNETRSALTLTSLSSGHRYTLRIDAEDLAGNTASGETTFEVDVAPEPPEPQVRALKAELNQAVQTRLFDVDGPGTFSEFDGSWVRLVGGKDLVVRYYLVSDDGTVPDFTADLSVTVFRRDGTVLTRSFGPNTDVDTVTVPEDPVDPVAQQTLLWEMRPDETRTLNFVVPGSLLVDAERVDVELEGVTGHLQGPVSPALALGVVPYRVVGTRVNSTLETNLAATIRYTRASHPVADVRIPNGSQWVSVTGDPGEAYTYRGTIDMGDGRGCPVGEVAILSIGSRSRLPSTDAPDFAFASGLADGIEGCTGVTRRKAALLKSRRDLLPYTVATTEWRADVLAHEGGHTLGLVHASDDHGESDGGSWEPWPYPHGVISSGAVRSDLGYVVGVAAASSTATGADWDVTLIDPCPGASVADRTPVCTLPDGNQTHDVMSYGNSERYSHLYPVIRPVGISEPLNWVSDINYDRMYERIGDKRGLAPRAAEASANGSVEPSTVVTSSVDLVEGLVIVGTVHENGTGELIGSPARMSVPSASLTPTDPNGTHRLELSDESGVVLVRREFVPLSDERHQEPSQSTFLLVVEYREGIHELTVTSAGQTLLKKTASETPPTVRLTGPNGGEVFADGVHRVTWETSDADGDDVTVLVQYSPDGGKTWQAIGYVAPGGANEVPLVVDGVAPGTRGVVRVSVSDGLNTAVDQSDGFFSVGTDRDPDDEPTECPTLPGRLEPAQDLDGDGDCEDIDGNGQLDSLDVVRLLLVDFSLLNDDTDRRAAFDFDGSGQVDLLDAAELLIEIEADDD